MGLARRATASVFAEPRPLFSQSHGRFSSTRRRVGPQSPQSHGRECHLLASVRRVFRLGWLVEHFNSFQAHQGFQVMGCSGMGDTAAPCLG